MIQGIDLAVQHLMVGAHVVVAHGHIHAVRPRLDAGLRLGPAARHIGRLHVVAENRLNAVALPVLRRHHVRNPRLEVPEGFAAFQGRAQGVLHILDHALLGQPGYKEGPPARAFFQRGRVRPHHGRARLPEGYGRAGLNRLRQDFRFGQIEGGHYLSSP